ncbi:MAG: T9SS type A sorting domain-containing protein [Flavipsychrobacter sp.]|nr:T9SS type A sorting domain-containing protein [Flavipsychrobacter sp.]
MKKLYIFLLLAALFSTKTFAQSADLQLLHTIARYTSTATLHYMNNKDTVIVNPTVATPYYYGYEFVNHGTSALLATDTIHLHSFIFGNIRLSLPSTGFPVGDTLSFGDTVSLFTGVTAGTYNWCDSIYYTHVSGAVGTDPVLTNNVICNTVVVQVYNVGVAQLTNNVPNGLSIYPNPASTNVNFNYDFSGASKASLIISDVVGRTVYQEEITDLSGKKNITVNVNSFVPGIYVATLVVDDARIVGKFNVQK